MPRARGPPRFRVPSPRPMPTRTSPTMKAAVYRGPNDLRVETVPVPTIGDGDVLVRVAVCGVSTADVKRVQMGLKPFGSVLGHEIAGTIERVGADVDGWRPGERVVVRVVRGDRGRGARGRRLRRVRARARRVRRRGGPRRDPARRLVRGGDLRRSGQHRPAGHPPARPRREQHRARRGRRVARAPPHAARDPRGRARDRRRPALRAPRARRRSSARSGSSIRRRRTSRRSAVSSPRAAAPTPRSSRAWARGRSGTRSGRRARARRSCSSARWPRATRRPWTSATSASTRST